MGLRVWCSMLGIFGFGTWLEIVNPGLWNEGSGHALLVLQNPMSMGASKLISFSMWIAACPVPTRTINYKP